MRCPGKEEIRQFVWQSLLDEDFEMAIGEHLDSCQKCLQIARRENQIKEFLDNYTLKSLGHLYVSTKIGYLLRILLTTLNALIEDQRNSTFKKRLKHWSEIDEIICWDTIIHVDIQDDSSIPITGSSKSGNTSFLKKLSYPTIGTQAELKDIDEKKEIEIRVETFEKSIYIQFDSDIKYLPLIILISENSDILFGKPGKLAKKQSHNLTFSGLTPGKYLLLIEPGEVQGENISRDTSKDDFTCIPLPWTIDDYKKFADNMTDCLNIRILRVKSGKNTPLTTSCKYFNPTLFYSLNEPKKNYPRNPSPENRQYDELLYNQKILYFLQHIGENDTDYNIQGVFTINGNIDTKILEQAFSKIIKRFEILRTGFEIDKERIIQRIYDSTEFHIEYFDYLKMENISLKSETRMIDLSLALDFETIRTVSYLEPIVKNFIRPFDLAKPPLLRVGITKMEEMYLLILDIHSIISDLASVGILIEAFSNLIRRGDYPFCKFQYRDYIKWKTDHRSKVSFKKTENHWKQLCDNELPYVSIPFDYPRQFMQRIQTEHFKFRISDKETNALKEITNNEDVTLKDLFFTLFNILIWKLSDQDDTIVIIPISGPRPHGFKKVIGNFDYTLIVSCHPKVEGSFLEFLAEVKSSLEETINNMDYTFEDLIENSNWGKSSKDISWFIPMFQWNEFESRNSQHSLVKIGFFEKQGIEKSDLILKVRKLRDDFFFVFDYNAKLFHLRTIERFSSCFKEIVTNISMHPALKLSDIDIISNEDKEKILDEFNQKESRHPPRKTIQQLFEEVVSQIPDNIAIEGEFLISDAKILNTHKNVVQLSSRELNNRSNQLAYILRYKGVNSSSIIAIKGRNSIDMIIGKLGILKAGGAYLLIPPRDHIENTSRILKNLCINIILSETAITDEKLNNCETISLDNLSLFTGDNSNLENINRVDDPAYIICCPFIHERGGYVMFEHRNVIESWTSRDFLESETNTSTIYIGNTESNFTNSYTWFQLINKHRIILVDKWIPIKSIYSREFPMQIKSITSKSYSRLDKDRFLRDINVGAILEGFFRGTEKLKHYRETGIVILDNVEKIRPYEIWGELCILDNTIPRGYLNDPELNIEKFVNNPFRKNNRLYKSGETARWSVDGRIEFFNNTVILPKVYGSMIAPEVLEEKDFMVIKRGVIGPILKEIGALKRDAQSLSKIDFHTPPRNRIEMVLCNIWEKVLQTNQVSIYDNFYEIGGDSVKAIKMLFLLKKDFDFRIEKVLSYHTISELSEHLVWKKERFEKEIKKVSEKNLIYSPIFLGSQFSIEREVNKHKLRWELPLKLTGIRNYEYPLIVVGAGGIAHSIFDKLIQIIDSDSLLVAPDVLDIEYECIYRKDIQQQPLNQNINCNLNDYCKTRKWLNILYGDFHEDDWGLSYSLYKRLSKKIDAVVVICGDNFLNTYNKNKEFYRNKAAVTKRLLEFSCQEKKKDFHYITTIDFGQVFNDFHLRELKETENMIRKFRCNGISTCIYRLYNLILNPTIENRSNLEKSFFYDSLRTFIFLGYAPEGKFGITFVEDASEAFALLFTCKYFMNETVYLMNPTILNWAEIGNLLENLGIKIKVVKTEKFIDQLLNKVYKQNLDHELQRFLLNLQPQEKMINSTKWFAGFENTQYILDPLSFQWSKLSETDLKKIIEISRTPDK